jgi:hypothetical protein
MHLCLIKIQYFTVFAHFIYKQTLEPQLAQVKDLLGRLPGTALDDRGWQGRKSKDILRIDYLSHNLTSL